MKRAFAAVVVAVGLTVTAAPAVASAPMSTSVSAPVSAAEPLTNLAHLDFLAASVAPPAQGGHTTYRLAQQPKLGVLWVYANHNDDGSYTRTGGGPFHADTNTYDQGAYDADDIARAAVVYLRHWKQFGDRHSREQAFQLLRGITYLQTTTGPDRGNVVLWMQPDGTLNPSALPKEEPDPSDSANSYWLARTMWALGEGYAAFRSADPSFARFLRARMDLALGALQRDSLGRYGTYLRADGFRSPAWLIVDDAGATGEAVLGLSAFVRAGGREAVTPLRRLASGIAALGSRPGRTWPYGALLPSATSRSAWHAWASQQTAALADAAVTLRSRTLLRPAHADAESFTPRLLASYGPISNLSPTPSDRGSIAYGADSRVQSLLAVARATHSSRLRELAGVAAGWYFGQNPSGTPMYDPSTGVTFDGVSADGTVNLNSGAESTIHGLLSMLALDASPSVARLARASGGLPARDVTTLIEGEAAATTGAAAVATADPASTAESTWSDGKYLSVRGNATATWTVPASSQPRTVEAVIDRVPGRAARARFSSLGSVSFGGGAPQGASAVPGRLVPVVVGMLPAGATTLHATFTGGVGRLDALLLTPRVSTMRAGSVTLTVATTDHSTRWHVTRS